MQRSSHNYILQPVPVAQRDLWDRFVANHPSGHLLQSWPWGDLKRSPSWHPLRLALWDQETRSIVACAQVLRRSVPHLPPRLAHLAYIPRGPVLEWSRADLYTPFFSQLDHLLRKQGALSVRIEPGLEDGTPAAESFQHHLRTWPSASIHPVQPLRTIVLDLQADEDELRARMKEKWRYNIGLAARKGVTVRPAETSADVQSWYQLLQATSARDHFGVHTLDYYLRAWQLLGSNARLFLAEYTGQLLAGIFVTCFGHEAIYLYGASSNTHRNLMPNYLLQWEAMRWARAHGAQRYDLWGIPDTDNPDEAMAGVYRFKSGWGGQVVRFTGCYEHTYRPLPMSIARHFF